MLQMPYQPPTNPAYGGFQQSIPNYGAGYRYPEYAALQQRARENGTLDGTPVTPRSSFQEDQFSADMLTLLNQRAAGRVMDEARRGSPREFQALQRHEGQLQEYLQQQGAQGKGYSPSQINRMRAEGIENLYQGGQVGQGIGQANREYMELLEAWERSEANQQFKYGVGPMPGLAPQTYQESPFNPQRQMPQRQEDCSCQAPPAPRPQLQPPRPAISPKVEGDLRRLDAPKPQPQGQGQPPAKANAAGKPQGPATPPEKVYDPSKDSTALYKSMHGGLTGLGTDTDALFKALDGKSQADIDKLKARYKDQYDRDLVKDLKGDLSGKDLQRAEALLQGKQASADAIAIRQGVGTLWNDNKQIHSVLEGKTAEQRKAIADEYKKQTGKDLTEHLGKEMSGTNKDQAMALLKGDKAGAEAAKLQKAVTGMTVDEGAVMESLRGKSKEEREAITKSFKDQYGVDLRQRLNKRLDGHDKDQANALLDGNQSKADAARLHGAMDRVFVKKDEIEATLSGKSAEERKRITEAYGKDGKLAKDIGQLSGNDRQKAEALLQRGKLSEAEQLKFAIEGLGTDEEAIKKALAGKSKDEIDKIRKDYQGLTKRSLDKDLVGDLDGRDLFDAQQAMKGKARTVDEAVERANEVHDFERGQGNKVSRSIMDAFSDKGKNLDRNNDRLNDSKARFERLVKEGRVDEARAEKKRLQELSGFQEADVEGYREAKDSAASTAGTIAGTAAGVAVVVASAGTATPLVATAAMAAGAGAGARVVTSGLIQGQGYGMEAGLSDAGLGAVDGGTAVIGLGAGRLGAKAAVKAVEGETEAAARETLKLAARGATTTSEAAGHTAGTQLVVQQGQVAGQVAGQSTGTQLVVHQGGQAATRTAQLADERLVIRTAGDMMEEKAGSYAQSRMVQGVKDGALGGSIGGGASTALDDKTWDQGLGEGLTRVAAGTALGATGGAVAGGAFSRIGAAKEWSHEVELYRNRANFNLLDDVQKSRFAGLANNYSSKGGGFVDGGPSTNVDRRLISMLRDGTVDRVDQQGGTVVDHLSRLDGQAMAKGLSNRMTMDEVMEMLTKPGVIRQDSKGTCTVTTLQYLHAKLDPADFARVVADLTSEGGETALKNQERILRNPTGLAADGSRRSNVDRIYQSTMMDYASGGHYDNVVDRHINLDGTAGKSGLYSNQLKKVEEGVLGGQWRNHAFDADRAAELSAKFESQLSAAANRGEHVPVGLRWSEKPGDLHSSHQLSAYKVDDEYVYMRNPWGKGEVGQEGGPPRQVLDQEGNIRMKKADFYRSLQDWDEQVSKVGAPKPNLQEVGGQMLDKFRKQMEEFSDDRWMKSTPEEFWKKMTPQERELHRARLQGRAAQIVRDLESGRNVHEVAEQYNLTDYYNLGDRQNRSKQFINRSEGTSNVHGVNRDPKAAPPPPPPPPPKPEPPPMREVRLPKTKDEAYAVLGLRSGASPDEIKAAYRKMARSFHPDHFQGDTALATRNMQAVNVARDLLA